MKSQEVVTFAKFYDFKNDEGQMVKGGEIHTLSKSQYKSSDFGTQNGHQVIKVKTTLENACIVIDKVPCICDIDYNITADNKGNMKLVPETIKVVKELNSLI